MSSASSKADMWFDQTKMFVEGLGLLRGRRSTRGLRKGGRILDELKDSLPWAGCIAICHNAACRIILSALKGLRNNDSEK